MEENTETLQESDLEAHEIIDTINTWIESSNDEKLLEYLQDLHPADVAETMTALDKEDNAIYLFRLCEPLKQGQIIVELNEDILAELIESLNLKEISLLSTDMESDDLTYLLSEIPQEKAEHILNSIDSEESSKIRSQLQYEENTAGRLMSTEFVVVRENESVRKGIYNLRKISKRDHKVYIMYVVNTQDVVTGYVSLKDLFFAKDKTKIHEIMNSEIKTVQYDMDQEEVARFFQKYDYISAAVVDENGVMLGRITVDDVLDIVEEEASEDILRMAGLSEDEKFYTPIFETVKSRIPWLHINLITAVLASSVVTFFESTIDRAVVLASLMPIVAGMGGNAGTQAITIVVRNIAIGELSERQWKQAISRELIIGLLNGVILGCVTAAFVFIFKQKLVLSLVIGSAMLINLIVAGLVGSGIPLLLKYLGIDPAIASSIFVTTFTDIFGFFCFLGLASLFVEYL
ncbi:MAG: magnesium transporter [Spirochaetota bacterium]